MKRARAEFFLEIGLNDDDEVIVEILNKKQREQHKTAEDLCACGIDAGHMVFSPSQVRNYARMLNERALAAEVLHAQKEEAARFAENAKKSVDRSARQLSGGAQETPDHRDINPATGQQKGYVVLAPAERAKGFVRPVRTAYVHVGLNPEMHGTVLVKRGERGCGHRTEMSRDIAETYARDPGFYSGTFCVSCREHRPLNEFFWEGTAERVGS